MQMVMVLGIVMACLPGQANSTSPRIDPNSSPKTYALHWKVVEFRPNAEPKVYSEWWTCSLEGRPASTFSGSITAEGIKGEGIQVNFRPDRRGDRVHIDVEMTLTWKVTPPKEFFGTRKPMPAYLERAQVQVNQVVALGETIEVRSQIGDGDRGHCVIKFLIEEMRDELNDSIPGLHRFPDKSSNAKRYHLNVEFVARHDEDAATNTRLRRLLLDGQTMKQSEAPSVVAHDKWKTVHETREQSVGLHQQDGHACVEVGFRIERQTKYWWGSSRTSGTWHRKSVQVPKYGEAFTVDLGRDEKTGWCVVCTIVVTQLDQ